MTPFDSIRLSKQSFDTVKAFDALTVANSSLQQPVFPASIWQILQHLLVWQEHQLNRLRTDVLGAAFDEERSWNSVRVPPSEEDVQTAVTQFNHQLVEFQTYTKQMTGEGPHVLEQALILQAAALHLSFHFGEVVLIRRLQGSYPWPSQMAEFLQTEQRNNYTLLLLVLESILLVKRLHWFI